MIPTKAQDLLSSYLFTFDDVPPWIVFGRTPHKTPRFVFLSRIYLCHLATGGQCLDPEDCILVEMLLAGWLEQEKGVTP